MELIVREFVRQNYDGRPQIAIGCAAADDHSAPERAHPLRATAKRNASSAFRGRLILV